MRRVWMVLLVLACRRGPASGVIDVEVTAKGFEPDRIEVAAGKPVTLRFTRKVAETCADAVDVQGDPVRHMLPLNAPVEVKVTAPASGQLAFACPMQMFRGAITVVGQ
jgi:plastocyanin domain-containing protein